MARLTAEQIKQGIFHDDIEVRTAAVHYFGECGSSDTTVMPVAIEAFERFGKGKAFRYASKVAELAQTEATVAWAIGQLHEPAQKVEFGRDFADIASRLLVAADPRLTQPREREILAAPGFREMYREKLLWRHKFVGWDEDEMWRELVAILDQARNVDDDHEPRWDEADDIIDIMALRGVRDVERMMESLRTEYDEGDPLEGMESLMVRLAGGMRHAAALPLIVAKLHKDYDILSEECQTALGRIGTDEVIDAIHEQYLGAEWHFRLYATGALEQVHTDRAVEVGIELLEKEPDASLRDWLAGALTWQFSTEGNEAVYKHLVAEGTSIDALLAFVPSCLLTGQTFPELEAWGDEVRGEQNRVGALEPRLLDDGEFSDDGWGEEEVYQPPKLHPITATKRPGRNDPCFCGSGKKYKKCCLNRESP